MTPSHPTNMTPSHPTNHNNSSTARSHPSMHVASHPTHPHQHSGGGEESPPPVSGIIFTPHPAPKAAVLSEQEGGRASAGRNRGDEDGGVRRDDGMEELVSRIASASLAQTQVFGALLQLHALLQSNASTKGVQSAGLAPSTRQEILKSKSRVDSVVATCVRALSCAVDDLPLALAGIDILALLATDVAARQTIIVTLQREATAPAALAHLLSSTPSPSASTSSADALLLHHVLMVIGNLAIDASGRKIILSQGVIMQQLLRLLWTDEHQDSPSAIKTLRFATGALRSLVLDARGKELVLNGAFVYSGAQVLKRLSQLQESSNDINTAKYVAALLKRIKNRAT